MSIADLIERLEKSTGPDADLDTDIMVTLGRWPGRDWWSYDYQKHTPAHLTSSIDAALTTFSRTLPGWRGSIQFGNFGGPVNAYVCADETVDDVMASHPVPAIALCIAILKAKQAQEPTE
jgi:hypothetical protein